MDTVELVSRLTSKDSKTLKYMHSLKKKKVRQEKGEYLTEGLRAVTDMMKEGYVRYAAIKVSKYVEYHDFLDLAKYLDTPVYVLDDELFTNLEETVNGQGIVAVVSKKISTLRDFKPANDIYLLLDSIQDPGNLGTIIRTAVGAGVQGIFLMKGCVDVYNDKTIRSTMSAVTKIPLYENVSLDDVKFLKKKYHLYFYGTALENASSYHEASYKAPVVLVVGNEANGISKEVLDLCDERIKIPLYGDIESLNVSIASALCLYKIREFLKV